MADSAGRAGETWSAKVCGMRIGPASKQVCPYSTSGEITNGCRSVTAAPCCRPKAGTSCQAGANMLVLARALTLFAPAGNSCRRHAEPVPVSRRRRHPRRDRLWQHGRADGAGAAAIPRNHRDDSAGPVLAAALSRDSTRIGQGEAARPTRRPPDLAVSRHAGRRTRRATEYACGLSRRPRRLRRLHASDRHRAGRQRRHSLLSRRSFTPRAAGVVGRTQAVRDPAALSFSLFGTPSRRRPGRDPRRTKTRPSAAEGAEHRRCRPADRHRARRCAERGRRGKPARGAALLPARTALRHRLARVRTRGAAGVGRAARSAHADGARQGRQGASGAAQRRGATGDVGLSRHAEGHQGRGTRNGCFPPSARAAI